MKLNMLVLLAAVVPFVGCDALKCCQNPYSAVSPDGRNEIRLTLAPFGYQVWRDGVKVVEQGDICLKVNGRCLKPAEGQVPALVRTTESGTLATPIYKKAKIDLSGNFLFADFGDWGLRLAARNDGVAYRFETKMPGRVKVNGEKTDFTLPSTNALCTVAYTYSPGCEEMVPETAKAGALSTDPKTADGKKWQGRWAIYLPMAYTIGGKWVAVTESDAREYPLWNLGHSRNDKTAIFRGKFDVWPLNEKHAGGPTNTPGRYVFVGDRSDYFLETAGTRTFPWRTFILADRPSQFCEADIVMALASPADPAADFSWVKPGLVQWDWWNNYSNLGWAGCCTKVYEQMIDFAAEHGIPYVIFDEGWSETLYIWKFNPKVDVPHLIDYAAKKNVDIILWMAWAAIYENEEKVAKHFAKLGAKGFKVDFMDRGDAKEIISLEKFAAACAKEKMVIDYHGMSRPTGLSRKYPNILNYEGVHGLEMLKFYRGQDMMSNDVKQFFLRMTAGPMDYTPGAMNNYPVDDFKQKDDNNPGSMGTRCRQMAMMALYEAPLQMLCDSPANYKKNPESFAFMSKVPVVWANTVGLGGCPDSLAALARQAKDGSWYAAGITDKTARDFTLDTAFLGEGMWKAEIFRDAADADTAPEHYVHEQNVTVKAGDKIAFKMARGGGFVVKFTK